jgi:hypothetical protein
MIDLAATWGIVPAVAEQRNLDHLVDYRDAHRSQWRRDYLRRDASLNYFSTSATKNFLRSFQRRHHMIAARISLNLCFVSQRNARLVFLIVKREPKKQAAFKKLNVTDLPFVFHRVPPPDFVATLKIHSKGTCDVKGTLTREHDLCPSSQAAPCARNTEHQIRSGSITR